MEYGNSSLSLPTCVECSQTREHPHYLCLIQQYTQLWEWRDNTAIAFGWPTKTPKCVPPPQSAHLLRQMVFNKWQRDWPCQNIVWYSSAASSLMARYGIQREKTSRPCWPNSVPLSKSWSRLASVPCGGRKVPVAVKRSLFRFRWSLD